ncbi:MHS family MFS transporter [Burkholderia sp. MS455]|uniref:Nitrate/nitrite transporter NarK n=1 Tax=Burkholderia pyrrocinia TaxID=60550 RepID=A0A318HW13_BURPY|nr:MULTISPECIES: MFS transporter [Burkholderia]PXX22542.1 nitrate/nitrite transporter NarK [Burkholderia pyrrocinia]QRR05574.1 MHS family MFS transporter [Burkholderia sp. MS455]SFW46818.1 Nitrate/nitrite transporter NarK [Burkholderia sp. NFACC33-1]SFY04769.1 Nitrate/nitrite transporter NarK [Burkholderia sp. NFPP32]
MNSIDSPQIPVVSHRPLAGSDHRTLVLAALGGALEFYDFVIYVFFAAVIGQLFFPQSIPDWLRQMQTFGVFAAGYLARPLGGVIMAHFGDLVGRKRMFTMSVMLMALPTLMMGLLPTYESIGVAAPVLLLLCRVLQGAAVGGEVPGAWVFVSEHVPPRHVGYACGLLTGGLTLGILLGSLIASGINHHYSPAAISAYAWRMPFVVGGLFGILSAFLRRWLNETPVFIEMKQSRLLAGEVPLKAVLRDHGRAVLVSMILTWTLTAAIVVVILMTPTLVAKRFHIAPALALQANSAATLCLTIGCVVAGSVAGRIGTGRTIFFGCMLLGASYFLMATRLSVDPSSLLPLYAVSGFFVGAVAAIPVAMVNAFPPVVRFSGISFSYNVAYAVFGGLTPVFVSVMLKSNPQAPEIYVGALCIVGALAGLALRPAR